MIRKLSHRRGKTIHIDYTAPCAAAHNSKLDDKAALMAGTERAMAAFLCAVQRRLGPEAARRAAGYWLEAFESATWSCGQAGSALKRITIAAANRLEQETVTAGLISQTT